MPTGVIVVMPSMGTPTLEVKYQRSGSIELQVNFLMLRLLAKWGCLVWDYIMLSMLHRQTLTSDQLIMNPAWGSDPGWDTRCQLVSLV